MAAAYTFLQRNPKHELTAKYLNYYRGMLDIADESLTDLEAQPYEVWGEWEGWLTLVRLPTTSSPNTCTPYEPSGFP